MLRLLSFFGIIALFLTISPVLRGHVASAILAFVAVLENYSPYSYVVAVLGVFAVFTISLNRGTAPR